MRSGERTLNLAQAYLDSFETGVDRRPVQARFRSPAEADIEASGREEARRIVKRVVEDLGRLLGTSETVARIQEWRESYAENLLRCPFGNPIEVELEALVKKGIRARNRWVYYHHLRILQQTADDYTGPKTTINDFRECLESLQKLRPDDEASIPEETEERPARGSKEFVNRNQADVPG